MLARLNEIYIDARYPAAIGLLPGGIPTFEDAIQLLEYAKSVYGSVTAILQQNRNV